MFTFATSELLREIPHVRKSRPKLIALPATAVIPAEAGPRVSPKHSSVSPFMRTATEGSLVSGQMLTAAQNAMVPVVAKHPGKGAVTANPNADHSASLRTGNSLHLLKCIGSWSMLISALNSDPLKLPKQMLSLILPLVDWMATFKAVSRGSTMFFRRSTALLDDPASLKAISAKFPGSSNRSPTLTQFSSIPGMFLSCTISGRTPTPSQSICRVDGINLGTLEQLPCMHGSGAASAGSPTIAQSAIVHHNSFANFVVISFDIHKCTPTCVLQSSLLFSNLVCFPSQS
mmetsp:Transcript_27129/g.105587  ORF Transcript_27129/g.105587 Transcript_27129/m.105587 type:complete len:288 (+) Transcript_27129:15-878(+)